ncbi:hypothetical protein [Vibrio parahaemolyticus]|uniref:hypothetical protein n=1 Tax=Vibrio parahaemolyticus TaxID=670 RepID=UPI001EDBF7DB|nr:hypothetical protein [Vibrio parahaemolyticus]
MRDGSSGEPTSAQGNAPEGIDSGVGTPESTPSVDAATGTPNAAGESIPVSGRDPNTRKWGERTVGRARANVVGSGEALARSEDASSSDHQCGQREHRWQPRLPSNTRRQQW